MPYTNATISTSLDTTYNSIAPYTSFISLQLITGIALSAQLEVERVFASDRATSTTTVTNFLNNADIKLSDKRAVFIIPMSKCTLNAANSTITAINLNNYDYTYYLISDPTNALTIQVPEIVQGDLITIRRKTVTNQSFVTWNDGSKLTSAQLNLQTRQLLYVSQELSDTLNTELARASDVITNIANNSITTAKIVNNAVTPSKISTTTDPWFFYGTIQIAEPTAHLHATTRSYTLNKLFEHGVITKDTAPGASAVDILETSDMAGPSGLWFNPINGTISVWAGNAWVTVAGTPATTANLVSTNTVQTLTASKTFNAGLSLGDKLNIYKAATAPTYAKGAMYFDTTLNKLRIGGATAWETITSI